MSDIEWLWEGTLESPAVSFSTSGQGLPVVKIGKPAWWDEATFGNAWLPPAGGARYGLARFAFALLPQARQRVTRADLHVGLKALGGSALPPNATATFFDLLPRTTTVAESGELKASLGPVFKLPGGLDLELASIEATEHAKRLVPVRSVSGIGQPNALWACTHHDQHPLTGDQLVYAVIELPPGAVAARATLALSVEARGPWGPIAAFLPQAAQAHLNMTLGAGN